MVDTFFRLRYAVKHFRISTARYLFLNSCRQYKLLFFPIFTKIPGYYRNHCNEFHETLPTLPANRHAYHESLPEVRGSDREATDALQETTSDDRRKRKNIILTISI